ncbi:hypothetical protein IFVP182_C290041 [Vibrio parahaemolyticus]
MALFTIFELWSVALLAMGSERGGIYEESIGIRSCRVSFIE